MTGIQKRCSVPCFFPPKTGSKNASRLSEISDREADAILKHMWPLYPGMPKYKESYAVTLADKYAATLEIATQWSKTLGHMSSRTAKSSL